MFLSFPPTAGTGIAPPAEWLLAPAQQKIGSDRSDSKPEIKDAMARPSSMDNLHSSALILEIKNCVYYPLVSSIVLENCSLRTGYPPPAEATTVPNGEMVQQAAQVAYIKKYTTTPLLQSARLGGGFAVAMHLASQLNELKLFFSECSEPCPGRPTHRIKTLKPSPYAKWLASSRCPRWPIAEPTSWAEPTSRQ